MISQYVTNQKSLMSSTHREELKILTAFPKHAAAINKVIMNKCYRFWDNNQYPLVQGFFLIVLGQYDPAEQNTSVLLKISAQESAPPQVWFGCAGGSW